CMRAKSPKRPSTPEAPTASFPPPPLRLLPGGANPVPGRDFHPQSTSAFSRRTCYGDLSTTDERRQLRDCRRTAPGSSSSPQFCDAGECLGTSDRGSQKRPVSSRRFGLSCVYFMGKLRLDTPAIPLLAPGRSL